MKVTTVWSAACRQRTAVTSEMMTSSLRSGTDHDDDGRPRMIWRRTTVTQNNTCTPRSALERRAADDSNKRAFSHASRLAYTARHGGTTDALAIETSRSRDGASRRRRITTSRVLLACIARRASADDLLTSTLRRHDTNNAEY